MMIHAILYTQNYTTNHNFVLYYHFGSICTVLISVIASAYASIFMNLVSLHNQIIGT